MNISCSGGLQRSTLAFLASLYQVRGSTHHRVLGFGEGHSLDAYFHSLCLRGVEDSANELLHHTDKQIRHASLQCTTSESCTRPRPSLLSGTCGRQQLTIV